MPIYDYECKQGHLFEHRCGSNERPEVLACKECGEDSKQVILGCPSLLTNIVPSYPGCKKVKAGYVHSHGDKSATKVSVGGAGQLNPNYDNRDLGRRLTGGVRD